MGHALRDTRWLLAVVLCVVAPSVSLARSQEVAPWNAILFTDGTRIVGQPARDNLAIYRIADGTVLFSFKTPSRIQSFTLSPDEKRLLAVCQEGELVLWNVENGEQMWRKSPPATGLDYSRRGWFAGYASFSGNGERFLCPAEEDVIVFDARIGSRINKISPPGKKGDQDHSDPTTIAALGPDGSDGFLITSRGRLCRFDVASGKVEDTGITHERWDYNPNYTRIPPGGWLHYSVDGKYIAFPNLDKSSSHELSVVHLDDKLVKRDYRNIGSVGRIRAVADGGFLVTSTVGRTAVTDEGYYHLICAGVHVWPRDGRTEELWRLSSETTVSSDTDFSPQLMIGVTAHRRNATITDLRTGEVQFKIRDDEERGTLSKAKRWLWSVGALVLIVGVVIWRVRRRPRDPKKEPAASVPESPKIPGNPV